MRRLPFSSIRSAVSPKLLHSACAAAITLVAISGQSWAYHLRESDDHKALVWQKSAVDVYIDTSSKAAPIGADAAVRQGFQPWIQAGMPIEVNLQSVSKKFSESEDKGKNVVRWEDTQWDLGEEVVAITLSSYEVNTGVVVEADMLLNAVDYKWAISPPADSEAYDVQNVVTHEAGHFFGLNHSDDPTATMFATTPPAEEDKRTLSPDDLEGAAAVIAAMDALRSSRSATTAATVDQPSSPSSSSDQPSAGAQPSAQGQPLQSGGCSVSGAGSQETGATLFAILLAALMFARVDRRKLVACGAGALLSLAAMPAQATLLKHLSLDQLNAKSPTILRGVIESSQPIAENGIIFTEHTVLVQECLRGQCTASHVVVRTLGGTINGRGLHVDGEAELTTGQSVLLFTQPQRQVLKLVGMRQGAFWITGASAIRDLRGIQLISDDQPGHRFLGSLETYSRKTLEQQARGERKD